MDLEQLTDSKTAPTIPEVPAQLTPNMLFHNMLANFSSICFENMQTNHTNYCISSASMHITISPFLCKLCSLVYFL